MLKRVPIPRYTPGPLFSHSYPKTKLGRVYEAMDEDQIAVKYKRLSRTPQGVHNPKVDKLRPPPDRAISHGLSYVLRHGAVRESLYMRGDGFVKVTDLLALHQFRSINFAILERIVKEDQKNRYSLKLELDGSSTESGVWWIRANQGHSLQNVEIEMTRITDPAQLSMAVHGTTKAAWARIAVEGLSRMKRQHVHFAQGLAGPKVVSGMRKSSQVYIYLNVPLALESGLELLLSSNGVVLCRGDENGFVSPRFFSRVEWAGNRTALRGWDGPSGPLTPPPVKPEKDPGLEDAATET